MNIIFYLLGLIAFGNFFDLTLPGRDGKEISMSQFRGKKILIVNIASSSKGISQVEQLEQLHQKYKDRLTIIAVPSNSFGREPMNDQQLTAFLNNKYKPQFLVTAKAEVTGPDAMSVYKWLKDPTRNGLEAFTITENYQKFLISEAGKIVGIFAGSEEPMSEIIQNAVTASY